MRLVLVGWGAIAQRVAGMLPDGVVLAGVGVRPGSGAVLPDGVARIEGPEGLALVVPALVIEAAGRAAVGPWGMAALAAGADYAPVSTSALTDAGLLAALVEAARAAGRQVLIPPGALGGIDALAAAARLPMASVRHEIIKPPAAWKGTEAEALCDLGTLRGPVVFWQGPAVQAAARFPQNANVAAISALAGIGMDRTQVALVADPGAARNAHRVTAEGDFGTLRVSLENRPMASNPKTSELTALSLVRLIANRVRPLVI
jgi:aspartate dehydrogenase